MSIETIAEKQVRVKKIIELLYCEYPDAKCSLDFGTPHQLMVTTILAAQCTDERVNQVTPELFKKYPDVYAFAEASYSELQDMIKSTGFFRNKTISIIESARQIVAEHGGEVPNTMGELTSLTGVGRKTANLIMGVAYGQPAVIVDTHVKRISFRLGLTENTDPGKIENDLREILPEEDSTNFNHLLVYHGRAVCKAPKPKCDICLLIGLCPYGQGTLTRNETEE
jgi:endonuclease-3